MKQLIFGLAVGIIITASSTSLFGQAVSDEAKRHFNRGVAAVEMAKSAADYEAAIKEFKQAIDLAPDWADAYYNLGKVQEQAEKFADAVASFRQYLRLSPKASDTDTVKSLIDKLEYKAENTLTIADIISVLTSLSKWEKTGDCNWGGDWDALDNIKSVDRDSIKVRVSRRYRELESWETLQVDGPIVKYDIIIQICGGRTMIFEGKSLNCEVGFADEVEVVSKTKVIVRAVQNRVTGWSGDRIGNKKQCELSLPNRLTG